MFGMKADRFTGRKILVAGALDALGPALVHGLIRSGAGVLATDRRPAPLTRLADWFDGVPQVRAADPVEVGRWIMTVPAMPRCQRICCRCWRRALTRSWRSYTFPAAPIPYLFRRGSA